MSKSRKTYLDILKIIAIFLVIFNHLPGYSLYMSSNSTIKTWIYMFITMFTRVNVPLFIMASGALLLEKKERITTIYKKRVFRIIVCILLFGSICYFIKYTNNITLSISDWFLKITSGNIEASYWFLYEYLGMLILLPFWKIVASKITKKEILYLILLHFITDSLIPIINYILQINFNIHFIPYLKIPLVQEKFIFYLLIGYYLDNVLNISDINKKKIFLLTIGSITGILISSAFTYHQGINFQFTQNFVQLFDYVTTITVFITIKYIFKQKIHLNEKLKVSISKIASLIFGIYLLDPILKRLLYPTIESFLPPFIPTIFTSFIWCFISIFIGGIITFFIKKLPIMKNLL